MIMLEVLRLAFYEDPRRKGPEPFPLFYTRIENIFHVGKPGMGHDGAVSQRTWPPFHPPLKPPDHVIFILNFQFSIINCFGEGG